MIVGVDPGVQWTGLAVVDQGRVIHTHRLRGTAGAGKDWTRLASTARLLALQVSAYVQDHSPRLVAVETMEDQSGRMAYRWKHTTAACCQAIWDAAVVDGWDGLVTWQTARRVLRHDGEGYGTLNYLLQQGRAGAQVGLADPLDEHRASAATHALWAEARWRAEGGG